MGSADVQQKAAEWLVELKTTDDVEALWPAFSAWLQEAPENRTVYLELEGVWRITAKAMTPIDRLRSAAAERFVNEVRAAASRRRLKDRVGATAGIAGALIVALWLLMLAAQRAPHPEWSRYETTHGQRLPVALSDGSSINLNTDSRLWVRVTPRTRDVSLEQGEAFFAVAHDASRPFQVTVDKDVLQAKGTQFSVRRGSAGTVSAFILNGSVEVPNHDKTGSTYRQIRGATVIANAGAAVSITPADTVVENIGSTAVKQRLAWTDGNIDFDGTLGDAVTEFNRYNKRRLEVDPSVAGRRIQGIFKTTDPDGFADEVKNKLGIPWTSTASAPSNDGVIRIGTSK
jgi:transmembrane sensor